MALLQKTRLITLIPLIIVATACSDNPIVGSAEAGASDLTPPPTGQITPGDSTGGSCTLIPPGAGAEGIAAQLLAGTYLFGSDQAPISGTMADRGTWNVSTTAFPGAGFFAGISSAPAADQVCSTASLFGSAGTAACVTGSATAAASDVVSGKTFWNASGAPVTGTLANHGTWNVSTTAFPGAGYFAGISGTPASNQVCSTASLHGTTGTAACVTGSATAAASDVISGKTFWNAAGAVVTGTLANQGAADLKTTLPSAGLYSGFKFNGVDGAAPTNTTICSGSTILGVSGAAACVGAAGTGSAAVAANLCSSTYAWDANGTALQGSRSCPELEAAGSLSGLQLWLRADSLTGLADNSPVNSWPDQSDNRYAVYAPTLGTRPIFRANAQNGKPAIQFNGTNNYLGINPGFADFTSGVSFFLVVKPTTAAASQSWARFFEFGTGCSSNSLYLSRAATTQNPHYSSAGWIQHSNAITQDTFQIYSLVHRTTGAVNLYVNGVDATMSGSSSGSSTIPLPTNITREINYIGRSACGLDAYFGGQIAELILYSNALTDAQRQSIENYLNAKYAVY